MSGSFDCRFDLLLEEVIVGDGVHLSHATTSMLIVRDTLMQLRWHIDDLLVIDVMTRTASKWRVQLDKSQSTAFGPLLALPHGRAALPTPM
jgi:hypothetical protein